MDYHWSDNASCLGVDDSQFSYPDGKGIKYRKVLVAFSEKYCASCPVIGECLADADEDALRYTVRGGLVPGEVKPALGGYRPPQAVNTKLSDEEVRARQDPWSQATLDAIAKFCESGYCSRGHDLSDPSSAIVLKLTKRVSGEKYLYPRCKGCAKEARNLHRAKKRARARMEK